MRSNARGMRGGVDSGPGGRIGHLNDDDDHVLADAAAGHAAARSCEPAGLGGLE